MIFCIDFLPHEFIINCMDVDNDTKEIITKVIEYELQSLDQRLERIEATIDAIFEIPGGTPKTIQDYPRI